MKHILALVVMLGIAGTAVADRWGLPFPTRTCSADRNYCFFVRPRPIESQLQYFEDKSKGVETTETASAFIQRKVENGWENVSAFWLLNDVAPVSALVSSKGDVVTFDNWHMAGYGDDVVVIYRLDGTVVKQYSLEQLLSKEKVEKLPHTVSSIWWGGHHFLDEEKGHVVLLVVKEGSSRDDPQYEELRLELATGEMVKR